MKISLAYLPLLTGNLILVTIIVTTFLAYHNDHIEHIIPFISDTGTIPPESGIFGQMLNISWALLSVAIYCKYLQVEDILTKHNMTHKNKLNKWTTIVGLVGAFGVSIVANFQETLFFVVHNIGAVMTFGLGALYLCLQTFLYLTIAPLIGQAKLTKIRILISILTVVTFLVYFICAHTSYYKFQGENFLKWKREDGGYDWHNVSAVSEWICALLITVYFLMMDREFKSSEFSKPKVNTGVPGGNRSSALEILE